jgi:polar amino acid transport system substrate-binding protein
MILVPERLRRLSARVKLWLCITPIFLTCAMDCWAGYSLTIGKSVDPIAEISSRVLAKAYERIGIDVTFTDLPAERSLMEANDGQLDGDVNRIIGIEKAYPNLIRVPVAVNSMEQVVFTKQHDFTVDGWESLRPYRIAIRIGTKVAEYGTAGMNVAAFPTFDQVFTLLSQDRYDVAVAATVTGLYYVKKLELKDVRLLLPPLAKTDLYHYLHKKNGYLLTAISNALYDMQQDGEISRERELAIKELLQTNAPAE